MVENDWKNVLRAIYSDNEYWSMEASNLSDFADEIGLTEDELQKTLDKLESQKLIERDLDELHLTQRGFDHINSIEMHEEQLMTDRILLIFTTVLTIGIVITSSIALTFVDNPVLSVFLFAVYGIVFMVIGALSSEKFEMY